MRKHPKVPLEPLSPRLGIYRWQIGMVASILHRGSGLILVLFVPLYLWLLHGMTGSPDRFDAVNHWLHAPTGKMLFWLVAVSLTYHFFNGIRFLTIDAGWSEGRKALRFTARLVLLLTAIIAVVLAVML